MKSSRGSSNSPFHQLFTTHLSSSHTHKTHTSNHTQTNKQTHNTHTHTHIYTRTCTHTQNTHGYLFALSLLMCHTNIRTLAETTSIGNRFVWSPRLSKYCFIMGVVTHVTFTEGRRENGALQCHRVHQRSPHMRLLYGPSDMMHRSSTPIKVTWSHFLALSSPYY